MYQLIQVVRRHWQPVVALNLVILVMAIVGILNVKKTWTARAQLILPNATTDLNASLGTLGDVQGGEGLVFTHEVDTREILSKILLSNRTLGSVLDTDPEKSSYSDLKAFRELFKVQPAETSTTISLTVEAATSGLAKRRLEKLINSFQQELTDLRQDDAAERSKLIQQELTEAEKNLRLAEQRLLNFQKTARLADGNTQTVELVKAINALNTAQAQLVSRLSAAQAKVDSLSTQLGQSSDQSLQSLRLQANSVYQANRRRLAEIETELSQARTRLMDEHPTIVNLLEEQARLLNQDTPLGVPMQEAGNLGLDSVLNNNPVANLSEQLVSAQVEVATLQSQSEEMQRQIAQFNTELNRLPPAHAKLRVLQREHNIAEGIYNGLVAKLKSPKGDTFSAYPNVQVLDTPRVDAKPSGPGRRVVAMGALLASIFGSAAIVLFRESQNPLLSPDDLKELEVPILGRIPVLQQAAITQETSQWRTFHQIFHHGPSTSNGNGAGAAEKQRLASANNEFQRSASALSRRSIPKGRLLIGSAISGEGKTTIAFGLASALSNLGFRVLLVDADLQNQGLSAQLGHQAISEKEVTFPVRIASRLDFLPLAVEASALGQFLAQQGFEQALNALQNERRYEYVLVDISSINTNSELSLMLAMIPNLLLVIWPGKSLRKPFADSLDRLQQYGATIQGLLLNGVDGAVSDHPVASPEAKSEGTTVTV